MLLPGTAGRGVRAVQQPGRALHGQGDLAEPLEVLGGEQLHHVGRGAGVFAARRGGLHPHAQKPDDLRIGVDRGQPLARHRIPGATALPGHFEEVVEPDTASGAAHHQPLARQRGHRHLPASVDQAENPFVRHAHVREEDFVELGLTVDLPDGADVHAGLIHVAQKERDAPVLGAVGVRTREQDPQIAVLRTGRPHLLPVHLPAAGTVRDRACRDRGEV